MNASTLEIVHFSELEFVAKFALYTVQCALCSVQCATCNVQCAVCTVSHVRGLHTVPHLGWLAPVAGKGFLLKNTLTVRATHQQARVSSSELRHI